MEITPEGRTPLIYYKKLAKKLDIFSLEKCSITDIKCILSIIDPIISLKIKEQIEFNTGIEYILRAIYLNKYILNI